MRDWVLRWLNIGKPSRRDFDDLLATCVETLAKAKDAHISDLRVVIDKADERERMLAGILAEWQVKRESPAVIRNPSEPKPPMDVEHLSDVTVFDDADQVEQQRELERELADIYAEQTAEKKQ